MPRIFISYRRADSITITGRIYDRLESTFGSDSIFKDVDDIPLGVDFRAVIEREINACDILLVIIGPKWASATSEEGKLRLVDPNDFVRLEVEAALRNPNITVIPVLVHNAPIPADSDLPESLRPLTFLNAATIRDDPDFNRDLSRLIQHIRLQFAENDESTSLTNKTLAEEPSASAKSDSRIRKRLSSKALLRAVLALLAVYIFITFLVAASERVITGRYSQIDLQVGEIAPVDIHAPIDITYISDILTEQVRQTAIESVAQGYNPPDPSIARQQVQLAQQTLDSIDSIRRDPALSTQDKQVLLQQSSNLTLDEDTIVHILTYTHEQWAEIKDQVSLILERVMREAIRETDINTVRSLLPTQVSIRFSATESADIVALVEDFIRPNTFPNPDLTESERQEAVEAVQPVGRVIERGKIIINAGQQISAVDIEALEKLSMIARPAEIIIQEIAARGFAATSIALLALWLINPRLRAFLKFLFSWRFNIQRVQ